MSCGRGRITGSRNEYPLRVWTGLVDPARSFKHGSQQTGLGTDGTNFLVTCLGLSGSNETHVVARVIGHDPLRQFLVAAPGDRLQTLEASYDPHNNEWFNVYGNEDRKPASGAIDRAGMNWNSVRRLPQHPRAEKLRGSDG
jgi:hypothetical protein